MILKAIRQIRGSDFLRQNAVLFFGSLAVSILNYAYYPVLGRLMPVNEYGEVQVLISLFLQLVLFLTVLSQVVVNIVANYQDEQTRNRVVIELERLGLIISTLVFIVGTAFSWQLKDILHFSSAWPFIVLLLSIVATAPLTFRTAYLRGQRRFGDVSAAGIIGASLKLVAAVIFVLAGLGTGGAVGGVLAAQLIATIYVMHRAARAGFTNPDGRRYLSLPDIKTLLPELKFALFVLVTSLGVTILSSIDVLIVKSFFDAHTAGAYAGISTVAKIIFFLTASVAQVMLPSVKLQSAPKENRYVFMKSLVLMSAVSGVALAVFILAPQFVVGLLMGPKFSAYANLLPLLSCAVFAISLINLVSYYYIALRRYQVAGVILVGLIGTIWLLIANHENLEGIVSNLAFGSFCTLALFAVWRTGYGIFASKGAA